ncbi:hypothetical protein F9C11_00580 [Amycolatopsis sp. VS8301801F10]|uniref:hypothetical protein n=1 Tax=Amycolatopsis sp. VS8301801F10 TaxID=2652442 RepID=UPI0038FCA5A2
MVHQGKEFGVGLYELEKVEKIDFPVVSADYGDAIGSCDQVLGGALGPVYQTYLNLHETVTEFLKGTEPTWRTPPRRWAQQLSADQSASDELYRRARLDPALDGKL